MDFLHKILHLDYFIFFLIISLGLIIGRIKIKGISLGSSAIVISSLIFGYFFSILKIDITISNIIQNIGLVLFIYTIGIQSGPSFFDSLKTNGSKFIILALMPTILGGVIVYIITFFDKKIEPDIIVGIFTGAMTSTPGLAAAEEATHSDLASIGYSVAYPFGMVTLILLIKIIPKLFKINIQKEELDYNQSIISKSPELISRKYLIENEKIIGKTVGEMNFRNITNCNISRVLKKSNGNVISVTPDMILEHGDIAVVIGTKYNLNFVEEFLGKKITFEFPKEVDYDAEWFFVTEEKTINITLDKLKLKEHFQAVIIRIRRSGIDITPNRNTKLKFGDKINVSFQKSKFKDLELLFGNKIDKLNSFSFFPIAIGSLIGILLGTFSFSVYGLNIKFGITGGVLISSILLSYRGKTGPIIWSLSGSGNQLLRELSFLLFLVPIGLSAGSKLPTILSSYGYFLIFYTLIISIGIPITMTIIAKYFLKINMLSFLGILASGMTSSTSLGAIDSLTTTDAHKISYASTYPFALLAIILGSQILALLL